MKELGKITFPTDIEKGLCQLVNGFYAVLPCLDETPLFLKSLDWIWRGFIMIVLAGTVQSLVLCVPHDVQICLLSSHC